MNSISLPSCHISVNHKNPISFYLNLSSCIPISFPSYSSYKKEFLGSKAGVCAYSSGELLRKPVKDNKRECEESWLDYEDQILEDTVPLVGFVRMILHSGKYESGERLSSDHESMILQRLLVHHPEREKKIGSGIDYIMVGDHPDFDSSRCLFIVRNNGEIEDFSYWKCIKGLIRKKYPLYADSFIHQHFKKRRNFG